MAINSPFDVMLKDSPAINSSGAIFLKSEIATFLKDIKASLKQGRPRRAALIHFIWSSLTSYNAVCASVEEKQDIGGIEKYPDDYV